MSPGTVDRVATDHGLTMGERANLEAETIANLDAETDLAALLARLDELPLADRWLVAQKKALVAMDQALDAGDGMGSQCMATAAAIAADKYRIATEVAALSDDTWTRDLHRQNLAEKTAALESDLGYVRRADLEALGSDHLEDL